MRQENQGPAHKAQDRKLEQPEIRNRDTAMLSISRLKLRNFKSFKAVNIDLPPTFICFAGPNGSGKSNLGDAIRFAMGEMSLKSLRAKKVSELIHHGSRTAEVTLEFADTDGYHGNDAGHEAKGTGRGTPDTEAGGGDEDAEDEDDGKDGGDGKEAGKEGAGGKPKKKAMYELKRVIRDDGKIMYRLNGKKATRGAILEAMKKHNLDDSGRNIIAQGEVARIIDMGGKERRQIIDSVAGISDFEAKKKEAMDELATVETRIKDANLVLGEREAYLADLGREKEAALKFMDAKKRHSSAKATLLRRDIDRYQRDLDDAGGLEEKITFNLKAKEGELAEMERKINEAERARSEISAQLMQRKSTSEGIRRIEELKGAISTKEQLVKDREEAIGRLETEKTSLSKETDNDSSSLRGLESEIEALKKELKSAEASLAQHGGPLRGDGLDVARAALEKHDEGLRTAKEELITLDGQLASKGEIIGIRNEEAERIAGDAGGAEGDAASEKRIAALRERSRKLADEIDGSFRRTKEINGEVQELDRRMLELKEEASIHRARTSPNLLNPALQMIANMKGKGNDGIYGTVADLITFDQKYAEAVEAAGGARLLYVVVDRLDTATKIIAALREAKAGRASFIPLDQIRTAPAEKASGFEPVLSVVKCPHEARKAAEFVFGDTLLVDSVSDAKKLGIGSRRMVTPQGEIFERSGVVSGGRQQSSLLSANQLKKLDDALARAKAEKDAFVQELYAIREEESRMRAEKSAAEIEMRTMEMELKQKEARSQESRKLLERKKDLLSEAASLRDEIRAGRERREKLSASVGAMEKELAAKKEALAKKEREARDATEESGRKRADLASAVSSLRATIEGRNKELELRKKDIRSREGRLKEIDKEMKAGLDKITEMRRLAAGEKEALSEAEEKMRGTSRAIEKLMEQAQGHDGEITRLCIVRGERRLDVDRLNRDQNALNVKKATAATRLEDLKAEFERYKDAPLMESGVKKDELVAAVSECEQLLSGMATVNLAAVEMYDKKKQEIDEAKEKIGKLSEEREAIIGMISEIDEHKKEAFFETFYSVSDNFKKMFAHLSIGEGYLLLDDPNSPFDSGMHIRIKRAGKDGKVHDESLGSLSGGENSLVALMFIFALQFYKPSPFYILDEVDAALDKENSRNLVQLIGGMARDTQFIVVSHNDLVMSGSEVVLGVTKTDGVSRLVGVRLGEKVGAA